MNKEKEGGREWENIIGFSNNLDINFPSLSFTIHTEFLVPLLKYILIISNSLCLTCLL